MAHALTPEQLAELRNAYFSGVLTVRYADKTVTYRTLREMREILDAAEAAAGETPSRRGGRTYFVTDKGLDR